MISPSWMLIMATSGKNWAPMFTLMMLALPAGAIVLRLLSESGVDKPLGKQMAGLSFKDNAAPATERRAEPVAPGGGASAGTYVNPINMILELVGRGPQGEALNFRFTSDQLAGRTVILGSDRTVADVQVDTRPQYKVSRAHAKLAFDGHAFTIEDNNSSNGTVVDGMRLSPGRARPLLNGDQIRLADIELQVRL